MRTPFRTAAVSCSLFLFTGLFASQAIARDEVCVYDEKDYRGDELCLSRSIRNLDEEGWNDTISSIEIEGDMEVILYENADYRGKSMRLSGSSSSLRHGMDNNVSSIEIVGTNGEDRQTSGNGGDALSSKYPASQGWSLQQYCSCASGKRCYVRGGEVGECVFECPSGCKN